MAEQNKAGETTTSETIKTQLRKAFDDKAAEDLPDELMSLIGKLREQDDADGK